MTAFRFRATSSWGYLIVFFLISLNAHGALSVEDRARRLGQELRCPVCNGQSLNDSDASEAKALRQWLFQELQRGQTDEQIVDSLSTRFGEDIRLRPAFKKETYALWFFPLGLVGVVMGGLLWRRLRR